MVKIYKLIKICKIVIQYKFIPVYRRHHVSVMEVVTVLVYRRYSGGECLDVGHILA